MATVDSAGTSAVIPAGYYTSQGFQSLTVSQQAAATGAQALLTARQSLFSSLYATSASSAPTTLGVQINGASTPGQLAAQSGAASLQESQSNILNSLTATSGWLPTSVFQLNLLQTLTRSGLLGFSQTTPTAAEGVAQGEADLAAEGQSILDSVNGSGSGTASYLSSRYSLSSQYSLVATGSGVGGQLNATI